MNAFLAIQNLKKAEQVGKTFAELDRERREREKEREKRRQEERR